MPPELFVYFMFGFTALNHCMPRMLTNVGLGFTRWKVSVSPFALMPEMRAALPSVNFCAPTTILFSWSKMPYCAYIFGLRMRSQARWYEAAVTFPPSLNRRPLRMWNVTVLPFLEIVGNDLAASGNSCEPAEPALLGKFTSSNWVE